MAASKGLTKAAEGTRALLEKNNEAARRMVLGSGQERTNALLNRAAKDLAKRLEAIEARGLGDTFSAAQIRATLAQVRLVLNGTVIPGLRDMLLELGEGAAETSAENTVEYLMKADREFRGVGRTGLRLDEASMMDEAVEGTRASILRRLASDGENDEFGEPGKRAKVGILQRYGIETVGTFESTMRAGIVSGKSWKEMREDITEDSPFLQGKPKSWAERIVRTEGMSALNRGGHHAVIVANKSLGDMLKIVSENFDDRTGCFLGSTPVSSGVVRAIFRRPYKGPVCRVVTENGRDFTATPNHPMLTRRGWIRAGELCHGDDLVCDARFKSEGAAGNEHGTDRPTTLAEIFDSLHTLGISERRRGGFEDFHGDGKDGDVDVLRPNHELRLGVFSAIFQPSAKTVFAPSHDAHFCTQCGALLGADLCASLNRHRVLAESDPSVEQATCNKCLRGVVVLSDPLDRIPGGVSPHDNVDGHVRSESGMIPFVGKEDSLGESVFTDNPPGFQSLVDVSSVSSHHGGDLISRQSGFVEFDRVVSIEVFEFDGHVFNLSTEDGYYLAQGAYTGNCDSWAVHGQRRFPDEPFEYITSGGESVFYQHPPNRPNDRATVTPHRVSWELPDYLKPRTEDQVVEAYAKAKVKYAGRAKMFSPGLEQIGPHGSTSSSSDDTGEAE